MIETRVLARAILTLATVASLAAPAMAADMKGEYGARTIGSYPAVPVPAPIPIPDTFQWYIRGDAGYSLKSSGNLSVEGTPKLNLAGPGDHDGPFTGSFAFGRYITPSLRAEFGIDVRNQQTIGRPGSYNFTTKTAGPVDPVTGAATSDTNTYLADRQDTTTLASHTVMANMYYDVKTGSAFIPYIGAGLGVNVAQIKRRFTETANCTKAVNDTDPTLYVDPITGLPTGACGLNAPATLGPAGGAKGYTAYGPAMALMVGTAVQLHPGVSLDAGYRLMWQGSTPSIAMGSVMGDISKISAGARTDHELRMGLRWDIW